MKWTTEKPTETGWYWLGVKPPEAELTIVWVVRCRKAESANPLLGINVGDLVLETQTNQQRVSKLHSAFRFAGPIPEPSEGEGVMPYPKGNESDTLNAILDEVLANNPEFGYYDGAMLFTTKMERGQSCAYVNSPTLEKALLARKEAKRAT